MGQFTEGNIQIVAKSKKSAKKIAEQIKKLDEYIASKSDESFKTSISSVELDNDSVDVVLYSDKQPNAIWQMNEIFKMCKDLFKGELLSFVADYTCPENLIYQEWDENGEEA